MSEYKKIERVIIAGGGTGGHIFPAIAIANAIKKLLPLTNILFVGAKGKMEMQKVPQAGYKIEALDIAGYNRSSLIKNIWLPFKVIKSLWQVSKIFKEFKPDVVIGVGGYSSFPVLRYAQGKSIPTYIHESNSFAGKANMMLGKKAIKIFTANAGMEDFFPKEKIVITGNPVRKVLVDGAVEKKEALDFFGLQEGKTTILSVGGSLGAQSINDAIAESLPKIGEEGWQLIWQTGEGFIEKAKELAAPYKNVFVSSFIQRMEFAYAAADVIVSRSGAMAVAEICLSKKPVIFVPYPHAAEDHQTVNAQTLVRENAAVMIADKLVKQELFATLKSVVNDEQRQQELSKHIAAFAVADADDAIAKEILFS